MTFIDSHCHIDGPQFDEDRDEVVARELEGRGVRGDVHRKCR